MRCKQSDKCFSSGTVDHVLRHFSASPSRSSSTEMTGAGPVPSRAVLRFLRSQNEAVLFFTPNPAASWHPRKLGLEHRQRGSVSFSRGISTTPHRKAAAIDASLFNFNVFRPASTPKSAEISPVEASSRQKFWRGVAHEKGRYVSTERETFLKRLWHYRKRNESRELRPGDLPPIPNFLDDVGSTGFGGRGKKGKAGNELKLRCTEIDDRGNVTTVNEEFKKSELIAKVGSPTSGFRSVNFLTYHSMGSNLEISARSTPRAYLTSSYAHPQS